MEKILAISCSFFVVGLGQIVSGAGKRGLIFLLAFYFGIPISLYLSYVISSGETFLLLLSISIFMMFLLWLYSIIDTIFI